MFEASKQASKSTNRPTYQFLQEQTNEPETVVEAEKVSVPPLGKVIGYIGESSLSTYAHPAFCVRYVQQGWAMNIVVSCLMDQSVKRRISHNLRRQHELVSSALGDLLTQA